MKRYIIILSLFVILTSCLAKISRQNSIPDKSLYGYWSFEGVTWLNITRDSIYFVDEEAYPVKYSVNNDTIVWYFDGIIQKSQYKVVQDTLFMENEEGSVMYIRVNDEK